MQSNTPKQNSNEELKALVLGIGGGGALFEPMISPHNSY